MSRFAVAARELEGPKRGVGRWLGEVLAALAQLGRAGDFTLFTEGPLPAAAGLGAYRVHPTGPGPGGGATAWEQVALLRALRGSRPAALLGPAYSLPLLGRVPGVVALHDLSFEAHPEWFTLREGLRRRTLARRSAARARSVLVLSRFGASEVETRYGLPPARIRLVGAGVSERFRPVEDAERLRAAARELGLSGEVVLSVGSLFNRRRPAELIAAVGRLAGRRPALRLVLVGDDRTHPPLDLRRRIGEAGLAARTTWLEAVGEEQLVELYSLARVVVYLSDYEGLGLPPLEALACGAPVLASDSTALAETLTGRATLLADPREESIAAALETMLDAPTLPRRRPAWLEEFSWRRTAEGVLAVLEEAAG